MMSELFRFSDEFYAFLGVAFLCGSLPTGFLIAKYFAGTDIRRHGSGNIGATNVLRVMGKKAAAAVFTIDFLKGFLPVLTAALYFKESGRDAWPLWVGFGAILGHVFNPFLRFKGGKGIATGAGVLAASFPALFAVTFSSWVIVFVSSRIVSLSSLAALLALVLSSVLFREPGSVTVFFLITALLAFWSHRENIGRLLRGEEKRVG